jgi:predicted PurR-regulated permease PerM
MTREPERQSVSDIRAIGTAAPSRALAALAAVAVIGLSVWVLGGLADPLLLVFAGVLLAIFLRGTSGWLSRHTRLPAGWALAVVLVTLAGLVALSAWLMAPSIATQIDELTRRVPEAADRLSNRLEHYGWGRKLVSQVTDWNLPALRRTLAGATSFLSTSAGVVTSFVVFLFVGLFLAIDPSAYRRGVLRLVPIRKRARAAVVLDEVGGVLGQWLLGKFLSMAVVGGLTYGGLALLGIPLAPTLALLAALLTFIPYVGPLLALVPAILLGWLEGPTQAGYVFALYMGIQLVESYLLTPLVQKRTVSLPPALTIVSQVVMGTLIGGLGIVLATPLAAALLVVVKRAYVQDALGDDSVDQEGKAPLPGVPEERRAS